MQTKQMDADTKRWNPVEQTNILSWFLHFGYRQTILDLELFLIQDELCIMSTYHSRIFAYSI